MIYADHNILFIPFFAADEAQTLDGVLRNDQSVVEGMTDNVYHGIHPNHDNDILHLQLLMQNSRGLGRASWLTSIPNTSHLHDSF